MRITQIGQSLRYGERDNGINPVWDDANDLVNVHQTAQADGSALTFGEPVALRVDGGGFVYYQKREHGINLVWSSTPEDQWEITGGPVGTPVPTEEGFGLFNLAHGDHLVYGDRDKDINLMWWSDRDIDIYDNYPPLPGFADYRWPGGERGPICEGQAASRGRSS